MADSYRNAQSVKLADYIPADKFRTILSKQRHMEGGVSEIPVEIHMKKLFADTLSFYVEWDGIVYGFVRGKKEISEKLSVLLFGENSDIAAKEKYDIIEEISAEVISKLQSRDLTKATCDNLENHAYSVNDKISDSYVRNLHILSAV